MMIGGTINSVIISILVICGDIVTSAGTIQSTNHPNKYLDMQFCEWFVVFAENEKIELDFEAFDLEYSSMCQYDWVEIRDGNKSSSSLIGNTLCGNSIPNSISSTSNALYIKFTSDGSVRRNGFTIQVSKSIFKGICFVKYASVIIYIQNFPSLIYIFIYVIF